MDSTDSKNLGRGLGSMLERLYMRYNDRVYVKPDPLYCLYNYDDPRDIEVVGLIASSLAFGNVVQIGRSIERVLDVLGSSPAEFVKNEIPRSINSLLSGFKHRWICGDEISSFLAGVGRVLDRYGSLERCFIDGLRGDHGDVMPALAHFVAELCGGCDKGPAKLLPAPERGSACKRLNLYLRWMARRDKVDPGVWSGVPASMLLVPLDTHMLRFSRAMGLTDRNQASLKTAREVTRGFREISPADPVKYDFALTRLGIRRDRDRRLFIDMIGMDDNVALSLGASGKREAV